MANIDDAMKDVENAAKFVNETGQNVNEAAKKQSESFNKLASSNVDLVKAFGELTQKSESVGKGLLNVAEAVGKTFLTFEGLSNLFNNIGNSIVGNSQQLANAFEQMRANYVKATGDIITPTSEMSKVMIEASNNIAGFGVDTSNAALAIRTSLPQISMEFVRATEGVNAFTDAQKENLIYTTTQISQLEKLGVNSKTTAQNVRLVAESMGLSATSTKQAGDETVKTTLALASMNGSLTESAQLMQTYGDIVQIFGNDTLLKLQGQATATGIALDSLVQVGSKFDTFESAGETVGRFNSLLGADYLGVTEMMFAEPQEQVKLISQAFQDAGVSIEGMDPIQKKFLATTIQSTLGLKSQTEALRFLNTNEFERGEILAEKAKKEEDSANAQERLNALINNSVPAMESFMKTMQSLTALFSPFFTGINSVLSALTPYAEELSMWLKDSPGWSMAIGTVVIVLGILTGTLGTATTALGGFGAAMGGAFGGAAGAAAGTFLTGLSAGLASLTAAAPAVPVILAIGAAFVLLGGGIYLAATGMGNFISSFAKLTPTLEALEKLSFTHLTGVAAGLNIVADAIINVVDALNTPTNLEILERIEKAGNIMKTAGGTTGVGTTTVAPVTTTMAEKVNISIKEIHVKFDDTTAFKSKVQQIIFDDGSRFATEVAKVQPR